MNQPFLHCLTQFLTNRCMHQRKVYHLRLSKILSWDHHLLSRQSYKIPVHPTINLGEFYHIEVNKDGQWFNITYSDAVFLKNPSFKDYGNVLSAGSKARQTFSVDVLGVTLIPGEYRLVKTFLSLGKPLYELSVAVPFTVK